VSPDGSRSGHGECCERSSEIEPGDAPRPGERQADTVRVVIDRAINAFQMPHPRGLDALARRQVGLQRLNHTRS
jgi:hypothetical protein